MPRTAKKTSQKPAPGLPYGQGEQTATSLEAVPIPSTRYEQDPGGLSAAPQPQGPQSAAPPRPDLMMQARAFPSPGAGLFAQSQRPGEPPTVGLSVGPGGGNEMLRYPTGTTASMFSELAIATGDPFFSELARKAGFQ